MMFGIKTKIKRLVSRVKYCSGYYRPSVSSIEDLPLGKKIRLEIPTYDGSGQVVHPDIFFDGSIGKFVLAFTPYPHTDDKYENPCVAISDDGLHFYEEKAGLNPLAPAPAKDHNDDPDISLHDGVYSILYLETVRPDYQNVIALQSSDRLKWSRKVLHHQVLPEDGLAQDIALSPSVIWSGERCHCFFVLGNYRNGHKLCHIESGSLESLNFDVKAASEGLDDEFKLEPLPEGLWPWHVDVINDGGNGYLMLLTAVKPDGKKGGGYSLYIARSPDLKKWKVDGSPVLENCYRSSGFVRNGILYIYFSSNFYADEWATGLYKFPVGPR